MVKLMLRTPLGNLALDETYSEDIIFLCESDCGTRFGLDY